MAGQKRRPVGSPVGQRLVAKLRHQSGPPGRALLGTVEDGDRRIKGIGDELAQLRRLDEPALQDDLGARIALPIKLLTAEPEIEDRRQEHRLHRVAGRS